MQKKIPKKAPSHGKAQLLWLDSGKDSVGAYAITDSRDPLGLRYLEERIGDWFWPGSTRHTDHLGYFIVVLYGLHMADRAAQRYGLPRDDDGIRWLFGRFERFFCLTVLVAGEGEVAAADRMRGLSRTRDIYGQHKSSWPLDFGHLSRGEVGALGTYLPALISHRLVKPKRLRLTPMGWELAQWMWPAALTEEFDEAVIKALDPKRETVGRRLGKQNLKQLGEKMRLGAVLERPEIQTLLWQRLIASRPPPDELGALPTVAAYMQRVHEDGLREPLSILQHIVEDRAVDERSALKRSARIALCMTDLGHTMLQIFDRIYQFILASGYVAEWSECVYDAVTPELVADLNEHIAQYNRLGCDGLIAEFAAMGRGFSQTMRRFNTRNPHNTFESILNLHGVSQRALGLGEGWIARQGDSVFFRQASTEFASGAHDAWQPNFRLPLVFGALESLGRLA